MTSLQHFIVGMLITIPFDIIFRHYYITKKDVKGWDKIIRKFLSK